MIAGAALLVLLGLGLFVAGILTGVTALYWACVGACVVAAALLIAVRRQTGTKRAAAPSTADRDAATKDAATEGAAVTEATTTEGTAPVTGTARRQSAETGSETGPVSGATSSGVAAQSAPEDLPDPDVEEVEVTDLLLVVDLHDEVLVVDEHPRYHVADCSWLAGRETIPLPLDEARADGFTPCAVCSPDRTLAERARSRKHGGS